MTRIVLRGDRDTCHQVDIKKMARPQTNGAGMVAQDVRTKLAKQSPLGRHPHSRGSQLFGQRKLDLNTVVHDHLKRLSVDVRLGVDLQERAAWTNHYRHLVGRPVPVWRPVMKDAFPNNEAQALQVFQGMGGLEFWNENVKIIRVTSTKTHTPARQERPPFQNDRRNPCIAKRGHNSGEINHGHQCPRNVSGVAGSCSGAQRREDSKFKRSSLQARRIGPGSAQCLNDGSSKSTAFRSPGHRTPSLGNDAATVAGWLILGSRPAAISGRNRDVPQFPTRWAAARLCTHIDGSLRCERRDKGCYVERGRLHFDIEPFGHHQRQVIRCPWAILEGHPNEDAGCIQREVPLRSHLQEHPAAVWQRREQAFS
jgi:hypothetical protein